MWCLKDGHYDHHRMNLTNVNGVVEYSSILITLVAAFPYTSLRNCICSCDGITISGDATPSQAILV